MTGKGKEFVLYEVLNLFYFPAHLLQIEGEADSRDNMSKERRDDEVPRE